MGVFEHYQDRFDAALEEELSLQEYLELCRSDPGVYATAAERLLMAIGEPEFVDTSTDPRLSRIFSKTNVRPSWVVSKFKNEASMVAVLKATTKPRSWRPRPPPIVLSSS